MVQNNLISSSIWNRNVASISVSSGNITNAAGSDFAAPADPHIKAGSRAIWAGVSVTDVTDDIDGDGRFAVGSDQQR